ncbi:6-bladed beta-propeller [Parabacteroides sp. PF5-6]|uniref:6-bladed beta-propeller n=1 Tax=Parabacteroides sp. PF5-6 TaxID=1742403 RepID=UPI00240560DB|nr:6-bladed beta-propeller [Parabacteroides sp. PF5-6]MDF9828724.1 hypothetical protein [Parabacteroides sp. PF5-6]
MKNLISFLCVAGVLLAGLPACAPKEKTVVQEVVTVDVSREYPEKKMLLQDVAEVDYIRLETSDEMLWQGWSVTAFTDRYILNQNHSTGDILFFDRTGKALRKVNRQGGSGEEYSPYSDFLFDEDGQELYFSDRNKKKVFVYDLEGNFKRALDYAPDKRYTDLKVWDAERLIAYNNVYDETIINSYLILSKETGAIEEEFSIPQTKQKLTSLLRVQDGDNVMVYRFMTYPLQAAHPNFILTEISNDTIFSMNRAMELTPIAIQQPSRATMDPEVFLFQAMDSREYTFYYTIEKKVTGEGMRAKMEDRILLYDKKEGKLYRQNFQNDDFHTEKLTPILPERTQLSLNNQNVCLKVLQAADLVEAYENNHLTGRLKEIAKELDEEDNPVILVARFR